MREKGNFCLPFLHTGTPGLQKKFKLRFRIIKKKFLIAQLQILHQQIHTYFKNK